MELPADQTIDSFHDFAEGVMYAKWYSQFSYEPSEVDATGYVVDVDGDVAEDTLVFARGFQNAANNGLKLTGIGSTELHVNVSGLVSESTPPANAQVEVCGVQGDTGDLEIDADGNITSTILDFTTLNLTPGQSLWIGGDTTATTFAEATNNGYVRVRLVETNKIYIDNTLDTFVTDDGATKTIQIFIGSFIRDVPTSNTDKFVKRTYTFEAAYTGLGEASDENKYEYAKGNYANSFTYSWPGQALATLTCGFIGLDTGIPTDTKVTATRRTPSKTSGFNTTSDFTRLRMRDVDDTGLTTYFDSLDITINNNVSPRKVIGILGAAFVNVGMLEVTGSTNVIFTDTKVIEAVRENTTVNLDFAVSNDDGTLHYNLPSMTVGGADKSFPKNESITLAINTNAFEDEFFGYTIGITEYAYLPE